MVIGTGSPKTRRSTTRRGFTLIELLVVIAILALLLAMLSPSLRRALDVAKDAKCRSNEHQLQTAFIQYTNDNRMRGFGRMHNFDDFWMGLLGKYTDELDLIRVCPIATVERKEYGYGAARLAWTGAAWPGSWITKGDDYHWGSYGFNDWLYDASAPSDFGYEGNHANYMETTASMPAPYKVPVFYDSAWCSANPKETDYPMDLQDPYGGVLVFVMMARLCLDRHNMAVNVVFLDGSAKRVPLPELWGLQWHRNWDYELAEQHGFE